MPAHGKIENSALHLAFLAANKRLDSVLVVFNVVDNSSNRLLIGPENRSYYS